MSDQEKPKKPEYYCDNCKMKRKPLDGEADRPAKRCAICWREMSVISTMTATEEYDADFPHEGVPGLYGEGVEVILGAFNDPARRTQEERAAADGMDQMTAQVRSDLTRLQWVALSEGGIMFGWRRGDHEWTSELRGDLAVVAWELIEPMIKKTIEKAQR